MTDTNQKSLSAEVLLSVLNSLPSSIVVKDAEMRFLFSNKMHCEMIGRSESELLGKTDHEVWPKDQADIFLANNRAVIESGLDNVSEEQATNADGKTRSLLTRKAKLQGPDGQAYLLSSNTDITEIRLREAQYKALTETVPVGVMQIDDDGTVIFSNALLTQYFGSIENGFLSSNVLQRLKQQNEQFPGTACKFEANVLVPGRGSKQFIIISSGWLQFANGKRAATVSVIDISEMNELRAVNAEISRLNADLAANMRQLKDAQDELVSRGRMEQLGQLTATVAHELRNPLGAVRTSAFLLERKLKDKGMNVEAQLERINKGVVRCDNIITQLLDFSRNKALQTNLCDLDQWLASVLEEECKKLPTLVSISCNLGLANTEVPIDGSRLERAIVNLVNNASEAMVGQGDDPSKFTVVAPAIHISTDIEGNFARIVVSDNGPGMPPDVLARIREPLFTTKSFGTGLGVPAIEQIANQHGGRLDITSEVGKGASFALYLPLVVKNIEPMVSAA